MAIIEKHFKLRKSYQLHAEVRREERNRYSALLTPLVELMEEIESRNPSGLKEAASANYQGSR